MDLENHFQKKPDPKNWNSKNQSEIAACEQKTSKNHEILWTDLWRTNTVSQNWKLACPELYLANLHR